MLRKVISILAALAVLSVVFTSCAAPAPTPIESGFDDGNPIELSYDDGISEGEQGISGPGYGYIVEFTPPSLPYKIDKIRMLGRIAGSGSQNRKFDILIQDKAQKKLYSASLRYTELMPSGWTEIDIPGVVVNDNFSVIVVTNTMKDDGFYLFFDASSDNKHSDVVQDLKVKGWYLKLPKENINWMIRVVGAAKK